MLVERALEGIGTPLPDRIVVDGIRNVSEVDVLENRFGYSFTLVAVLATAQARWNRIGTERYQDHNLTQLEFSRDDSRDRNEEVAYGQQVELCVDRADVFIDNSPPTDPGRFREKVTDAVDLISRQRLRQPTQSRMYMGPAAPCGVELRPSTSCTIEAVVSLLSSEESTVLQIYGAIADERSQARY